MSSITIQVDAGSVALGGELDLHAASRVAEAVANARRAGQPVRIDLSDVSFIDSLGLRELVRAEREGGVVLVDPSERVLQLLEVTGLTGSFAVEGRAAAASPVTETQLIACLHLLRRVESEGEPTADRLVAALQEAVGGADHAELLGVLRMIENLGYVALSSRTSISAVELTEEGRRFEPPNTSGEQPDVGAA